MNMPCVKRSRGNLDELIGDLDIAYQAMLDKLEVQAREAILMDKAIRQILKKDDDTTPVMGWHPERAISPHAAFKALAMQIIQAAQNGNELHPVDYEDLLSWPDEPQGNPGESENHRLLRRIHYAKSKSLRSLWTSVTMRITPDLNPEAALLVAAKDLASAFGVEQPDNILVPYRNQNPCKTLLMPFNRSKTDIEWTIHQSAMLTLIRANHALATVCRLHDNANAATAIKEATSAIQSKYKAAFNLYKPGDQVSSGQSLKLIFNEHHINYTLGPGVWEHVWEVIPRNVPGIRFSDAPVIT